MKSLNSLIWQPRWVSHLGAVEGSLKYLNHKISTAWIYGGTGHAFVLNIAKDLCPSGPTAWKTMMLYELAPNLGYKVEGVFSVKSNPDFLRLQEEAWEHAKKCIDNKIPCYGWELEIPEYYVISGYTDVGYLYSGPGCENEKGPRPWKDVGNSQIGILEIYSVHLTGSENPVKAIKEALEKVIYHAGNPADLIFPNYRSGLKGYDWWISAIEDGYASARGHSYNAAVWAECRKYSVQFLKEAKKYCDGEVRDFLDTAQEHYEIVADNLESIVKDYPFSIGLETKPLGVEERTSRTVESLKKVKDAEAAGYNWRNNAEDVKKVTEIYKALGIELD